MPANKLPKELNPMHIQKWILFMCAALLLFSCAGTQKRSSAQYEFEKGLALFNDAKYEQAATHFIKASEIEPKYLEAYVYLGRSYLKLDRWIDAISPLQKAYGLAPKETAQVIAGDLFDAFFGASLFEFGNRNYKASIDYIRHALKLNPGSSTAKKELTRSLLAFGTKLLSEGKILEAIPAFKEAVELSPGNFDAYFGLAKAFFYNGEALNALDAIKGAIKIDPKNKELLTALLSFGAEFLAKRKIPEAISAYKQALMLSPLNIDASLGLARAFFNNGDFQNAMRAVRNAIKIDPKSNEAKALLFELMTRD
jgi:tetratricopeptide (TPR) repeat protein